MLETRNKPYTTTLPFIAETQSERKKDIKMTNNKNENKGSLISSVGGLFIIIGIVSMTMKSSNLIIFSCLIIGIILAAYGVIAMGKSKKSNDN